MNVPSVPIEDLFYTQRDGEIYEGVLNQIEKQLILWALSRTRGNQLRAAQMLGINRNTLHAKMKKLGIRVEGV